MSSHDEREFERKVRNALENAAQWDGSPQAIFNRIRGKLQPRPWYSRLRPLVAVGATALSLLLAVGIYQYSRGFAPVPSDDRSPTPVIEPEPVPAVPLPVVDTQEKLTELLERNLQHPQAYSVAKRSISGMASFTADGSSFSSTNVQVEGVDEADVLKTDGTYLYQLRGREVTISRIYPSEDMQVVSRIKIPDGTDPHELYVDGRYLSVIAGGSSYSGRMRRIWPSGNTSVFVYDLSDISAPEKIREVEVEGSPLSTRKMGSVLYLVAQKWVYADGEDGNPTVIYRDSANNREPAQIGLDKIRYFPGAAHESYLTVLAFDVTDGTKEARVDVYLGSGRNIYMSHDNLYVAVEQWQEQDDAAAVWPKTLVYRFGISGTDVYYSGVGEVPGSILNQFSMDEYNGHFRIATTNRRKEMTNNVYILGRDMKVAGRLEGLAPGEQIYSVRFMGDKGYLVTFELIDPLFVIDLKDPANPRVLGELKIPGFSNYLHPLDETTLLGIGRETEVVEQRGRLMVRENGMKLAIFDVYDVSNPKELHVEIIGESGSHSEALWNHKAVLFYEGVLALPVTIAESGKPQFQGAVAYRVSKKGGFSAIGKVSHYADGNPEAGSWDYNREITRSLIINDVFYTVSNGTVRASRLQSGLPELVGLSLEEN